MSSAWYRPQSLVHQSINHSNQSKHINVAPNVTSKSEVYKWEHVVLWQTSGKRLGDWANHQFEVVTDKLHSQSSAVWNVEEHRYSHGTQLNLSSSSLLLDQHKPWRINSILHLLDSHGFVCFVVWNNIKCCEEKIKTHNVNTLMHSSSCFWWKQILLLCCVSDDDFDRETSMDRKSTIGFFSKFWELQVSIGRLSFEILLLVYLWMWFFKLNCIIYKILVLSYGLLSELTPHWTHYRLFQRWISANTDKMTILQPRITQNLNNRPRKLQTHLQTGAWKAGFRL